MALIFSHLKHNKAKHSKAKGKTPGIAAIAQMDGSDGKTHEIAAIAQMDGSDGNIHASTHEDWSAQRGGMGWYALDIDSDFNDYDAYSDGNIHASIHEDWSAQRGGIGWGAPNGYNSDFDEYDAHSVAMASLSMSLPLMCDNIYYAER